MHHPTDMIAHTTSFVTPVVEHWLEREIAQWVHPMKDQSDDPLQIEQTLLPRSYILLETNRFSLTLFSRYCCPNAENYIYIEDVYQLVSPSDCDTHYTLQAHGIHTV